MISLLKHVTQVLRTDADLIAILPKDNIGATKRRPGGGINQNMKAATQQQHAILEYSIYDQQRAHDGKQDLIFVMYAHSSVSEEVCWEIAEAINKVMTATNLTPSGASPYAGIFRTSKCNQTGARRSPRNEWAASIRLEYSIKVVELDPVKQHQ